MSHPPSPAQMRLTAILRGLRDAAGMSTYRLADWHRRAAEADRSY